MLNVITPQVIQPCNLLKLCNQQEVRAPHLASDSRKLGAAGLSCNRNVRLIYVRRLYLRTVMPYFSHKVSIPHHIRKSFKKSALPGAYHSAVKAEPKSVRRSVFAQSLDVFLQGRHFRHAFFHKLYAASRKLRLCLQKISAVSPKCRSIRSYRKSPRRACKSGYIFSAFEIVVYILRAVIIRSRYNIYIYPAFLHLYTEFFKLFSHIIFLSDFDCIYYTPPEAVIHTICQKIISALQ